MAVEPTCSAAREFLSAHRLSPATSGRFGTASTQSPSPPGWNETEPWAELIRPTRAGGSSSSSARAGSANSKERVSRAPQNIQAHVLRFIEIASIPIRLTWNKPLLASYVSVAPGSDERESFFRYHRCQATFLWEFNYGGSA